MDKSRKQAQETRRRNTEARRSQAEKQEREVMAQIQALRQIRDDPNATSSERLRAVELLVELEKAGYNYI